jgi:hypothetical protein
MLTREERDHLYETYVRPLEAEHWGEIASMTVDGIVTLGSSLLDVHDKTAHLPKVRKVMFKVGPRVMGHIR